MKSCTCHKFQILGLCKHLIRCQYLRDNLDKYFSEGLEFGPDEDDVVPLDEMDHVDEVEVNELTKISNYSKQTEENMDETECDPRVFDQMKEYFCSGEITKEKRIEYRELNLKK